MKVLVILTHMRVYAFFGGIIIVNKTGGDINNMSSYKNLRIVDNFYQTSAFFPMPTVIISTLADNGQTNCGAYSLVQPYYIAGMPAM